MTLSARLNRLIVLTVIGLCILVAIVLLGEKNQLLLDRKETIRNLVEVAQTTVSNYEKQA